MVIDLFKNLKMSDCDGNVACLTRVKVWLKKLFLQAQPAVCSCIRALRSFGAEKQAGEATEEAGRAPRSAGEVLSFQEQLCSFWGASALPDHQEGKSFTEEPALQTSAEDTLDKLPWQLMVNPWVDQENNWELKCPSLEAECVDH